MNTYFPVNACAMAECQNGNGEWVKTAEARAALDALTAKRDEAIILKERMKADCYAIVEKAEAERDTWKNTAHHRQAECDQLAADLATRPTFFAYEAACAALQKHRERADRAEAECARLRDELVHTTATRHALLESQERLAEEIKRLRGLLARMPDVIDHCSQTVHRAYHEGPLEECGKTTCQAAREVLKEWRGA